jgi:hypothetical protein
VRRRAATGPPGARPTQVIRRWGAGPTLGAAPEQEASAGRRERLLPPSRRASPQAPAARASPCLSPRDATRGEHPGGGTEALRPMPRAAGRPSRSRARNGSPAASAFRGLAPRPAGRRELLPGPDAEKTADRSASIPGRAPASFPTPTFSAFSGGFSIFRYVLGGFSGKGAPSRRCQENSRASVNAICMARTACTARDRAATIMKTTQAKSVDMKSNSDAKGELSGRGTGAESKRVSRGAGEPGSRGAGEAGRQGGGEAGRRGGGNGNGDSIRARYRTAVYGRGKCRQCTGEVKYGSIGAMEKSAVYGRGKGRQYRGYGKVGSVRARERTAV